MTELHKNTIKLSILLPSTLVILIGLSTIINTLIYIMCFILFLYGLMTIIIIKYNIKLYTVKNNNVNLFIDNKISLFKVDATYTIIYSNWCIGIIINTNNINRDKYLHIICKSDNYKKKMSISYKKCYNYLLKCLD